MEPPEDEYAMLKDVEARLLALHQEIERIVEQGAELGHQLRFWIQY